MLFVSKLSVPIHFKISFADAHCLCCCSLVAHCCSVDPWHANGIAYRIPRLQRRRLGRCSSDISMGMWAPPMLFLAVIVFQTASCGGEEGKSSLGIRRQVERSQANDPETDEDCKLCVISFGGCGTTAFNNICFLTGTQPQMHSRARNVRPQISPITGTLTLLRASFTFLYYLANTRRRFSSPGLSLIHL